MKRPLGGGGGSQAAVPRNYICGSVAPEPQADCYFRFALLKEYTKLMYAVFCSLTSRES